MPYPPPLSPGSPLAGVGDRIALRRLPRAASLCQGLRTFKYTAESGWREKIFGRRYQAILVSPEDAAQLERFQ